MNSRFHVLFPKPTPGRLGRSGCRKFLVAIFGSCLVLPLAAQEFETPPTLKAGDLLEAAWLESEIHQVDPEVITEGGLDRFTIRTTRGVEVVQGAELVRKRIREIHATAELEKKRRAGAAVKGVENEGIDTTKTMGGALKKPVRTVFNTPKVQKIGRRL